MHLLQTAAVVAGLALSVSAFAADGREQEARARIETQRIFQDTIRESDLRLLFDYLRAAALAAAEGREVPPPPEELQKRAEILAGELKTRGMLAALLALSVVEGKAKELLRERRAPQRPALPPVTPFIPVSND